MSLFDSHGVHSEGAAVQLEGVIVRNVSLGGTQGHQLNSKEASGHVAASRDASVEFQDQNDIQNEATSEKVVACKFMRHA